MVKKSEITNTISKATADTQPQVLKIYPRFNDLHKRSNEIHHALCKRFCSECGKDIFE